VKRRVAAVTLTGHANSRVGSHFPTGNHQSSRLDTAITEPMARAARPTTQAWATSVRHGYNVATRSSFQDGNRKGDCVMIRGNKQGGGVSKLRLVLVGRTFGALPNSPLHM
jgi:hypothetical protein